MEWPRWCSSFAWAQMFICPIKPGESSVHAATSSTCFKNRSPESQTDTFWMCNRLCVKPHMQACKSTNKANLDLAVTHNYRTMGDLCWETKRLEWKAVYLINNCVTYCTHFSSSTLARDAGDRALLGFSWVSCTKQFNILIKECYTHCFDYYAIGRFSKAGLLEWIRFVIFHTRSSERSQRTSRPIFWVGVASCCV